MYKNKQLIILMAGHATRLYPLTLTMPKPLISVYQKPAIYNMIVPLIRDGLNDITFVVNSENVNIIKKFMETSFENTDVKFNYVIQDDFSGPGTALKLTKDLIKKETILLLGDTICPYPKNYDKSFIAVQKVESKDAHLYCIIESDKKKKVLNIIDKPVSVKNVVAAAIGLYFFKDYKLLKKILSEQVEKIKNEYQLSSYFLKYMEYEDLYIFETSKWNDIGTLENYINTNKRSFNCREFNSLYLDDISVLHKKSSWEKIASEMKWYKEIIKTDFEKMTPKFYNNSQFDNEYAIEYYDYLTLAEYFTFYPLYDFNKEYIFEKLFNNLKNVYLKNKNISLSFNEYMNKMLIHKTYNRIEKWERKDLLNKNELIINGKKYIGLYPLLEKLTNRIEKICNESINYVSIVHGDLAFSNILFSPKNMIYKFIDPRGNFIIDTIYGDYRYDLAKLRHCYHGRYDEIINDLFKVTEKKSGIDISYFKKESNYNIMDEIMKKNNININDIELIEGLLFISMILLHSDYPERQLAFFIQGIKMLNNQLGVK